MSALWLSDPDYLCLCIGCCCAQGHPYKRRRTFERLGQVRTIAIDKTGTLTEGRFRVAHFLSADPVLFLVHLYLQLWQLQRPSSHPLAASVVNSVTAENAYLSLDVTDYKSITGEGIEATVAGKLVQIGNQRMIDRLGLAVPRLHADSSSMDVDMHDIAEEWEAEANTLCWIVIDGALAGLIAVADTLRAEAQEAIRDLKGANHKRIVMLTGDNDGAAHAVQRQLELDEIHSKLLPEDKVEIISKLKQESKGRGIVAMVGDGINDAPALSCADVGVAMGSGGAAAALETANVVLMDSSLLTLVRALDLGAACLKTIQQNVVLSFATKMVMILLASLGFASLWLAVVADVGSMLLVCINGMRLLVYASDEDATDRCSKCFNESTVDGGCGCADPKPKADFMFLACSKSGAVLAMMILDVLLTTARPTTSTICRIV